MQSSGNIFRSALNFLLLSADLLGDGLWKNKSRSAFRAASADIPSDGCLWLIFYKKKKTLQTSASKL